LRRERVSIVMRRTQIRLWPLLYAVCFAVLINQRQTQRPAPAAAQVANVTAIIGVNLIPLDGERVVPAQTVIVRDGVIEAIGDSAALAVPANAQIIHGCGQYLLPGLIDMHTHVRLNDLPLYLEYGVTTVRNMWGYPALRETMRRINSGELVGPTIYSAGPGMDGPGATLPGHVLLDDPALAEAAVARQVSEGWDFIKVYQWLRPPVYQAILAAARRHGIRVVGHVATQVRIEDALAGNQASIEHLTGYEVPLHRAGHWGVRAWIAMDPSRIPPLVAMTTQSGIWNCPTLVVYGLTARLYANPTERELIIRNRRLFVKALHDAGAKLLAGTDAGIDETAPGAGMRDELAELVAAGLTPYEALRTATVNAAEFLGRSDPGSIAVGNRADLLLLSANPLTDVQALAARIGVMTRGQWRQLARTLPCGRPPTRRIRRSGASQRNPIGSA
jgi:imidazolonepropionase-like amidohydrolase